MRKTQTKTSNYLLIKELTGYDVKSQPEYKLRVIRLPRKLTARFVLKLIYKLSGIEQAAIVEGARSPAEARQRMEAHLGDDVTQEPVDVCRN